MTTQTENAIRRYRRSLEQALERASREVKTEAVQDADEFLIDEVRAMDVGRLTSEGAAYDRFVERFGTPQQLATSYLEQSESLMPAKRSFRWQQAAVAILLLAVTTGGVCYAIQREPPKLSPFTDVQFEGEQVIVTHDGQACQWLEFDELKVEDIVTSSKKQFGERWQKRISEDLVEVLWGMNHQPGDTVKLRLVDITTKRDYVVEKAAMTAENRRAIYRPEEKLTTSEPPKLSPFTDVQFEGEQVIVTHDGQACQWLELDELKVEDIVTSSKKQFGERWQKRISEDLVEVLWGMNHQPGNTVKLRLVDVKTKQNFVVEKAAMTEANRRAVQASDVPIDDAELQKTISEFLGAARIKAGFSGFVTVARGGRPVYQGSFGFSHLESKALNSLDTPFRIASLSKQFTAAAIFRLEAHGKLSIDDPVHRHLPEFAEMPYRGITIHHLLTHTSGLPRTPKGIVGRIRWSAMSRAATPVDDYVRLAVQMPLEFEPGEDYEYSNFGYRVLSALIARVTGRDYADFMEQELFRPLGMRETGVARVTRPPSEARIAEGLALVRLDPAGEPLYANGEDGRNYGCGYGSGGIYSSANDLLLWDRVLKGDEFLSESQKRRLFQPIHHNYACGWKVKKSGLDGRLYQMHSGANEGFFSQMMRLPEDDLVIIAVGNVEATPAIDNVLEQLFRLCRSLPYRNP